MWATLLEVLRTTFRLAIDGETRCPHLDFATQLAYNSPKLNAKQENMYQGNFRYEHKRNERPHKSIINEPASVQSRPPGRGRVCGVLWRVGKEWTQATHLVPTLEWTGRGRGGGERMDNGRARQ